MSECAVCSKPCSETYCSHDCYLVGTGEGFACLHCGVVKPVGRGKNLFCSLNCSSVYRKKQAVKTADCSFCGKSFTLSVGVRCVAGPKFCSLPCSSRRRAQKLTHPPVTRECTNCKTVVLLTHDKKKTLKKSGKVFCNARCSAIHNNRNRRKSENKTSQS